MLNEYYQRLYQVLQDDIETLLTEPDLTKRSPKVILEYLKMAKQCEENIEALNADDGWSELSAFSQSFILRVTTLDKKNLLSQTARNQLLQILEKAEENHDHKD